MSWAHTFGIKRVSVGENKLLYLITRNNILCCIFPSSPSPLSFSLPYIVQWIFTSISCPHYSSDISFPFAMHLPYLSLAFFLAFFFSFPLFLPFLVLLSLALLQSAWMAFMAPDLWHLATWISHLVSICSQKTRISTLGAQFICTTLDTSEWNASIHDSFFPLFGLPLHIHTLDKLLSFTLIVFICQ